MSGSSRQQGEDLPIRSAIRSRSGTLSIPGRDQSKKLRTQCRRSGYPSRDHYTEVMLKRAGFACPGLRSSVGPFVENAYCVRVVRLGGVDGAHGEPDHEDEDYNAIANGPDLVDPCHGISKCVRTFVSPSNAILSSLERDSAQCMRSAARFRKSHLHPMNQVLCIVTKPCIISSANNVK